MRTTEPGSDSSDFFEWIRWNIGRRDDKGRTKLWYAVARRDYEKVKILLEHGADPGVADHDGITPLHNALIKCEAIDQLIAKELLKSRPNTPVAETLGNGYMNLDQLLDSPFRDPDSYKAMEFVLDLGANVNALGSEGETQLIERFLNGSRVDINSRGSKLGPECGATALSLAAARNDLRMVSILLAATTVLRLDPNFPCDRGHTPLRVAVYGDHADMVALLLKADGIRINSVGEEDDPPHPLWLTIQVGLMSVLELFLNEDRLDINCQKNLKNDTYLIAAARKGDLGLVKMILDIEGVDLHARNKHGESALGLSSSRNHQGITQLLTAKGAAMG
ncbi:hypothetical protein N7488_012466 [Penicillium malachiteum]|nr:hypothetical protein N7488_012466 [Penicillium malachiteum]